MESAIDLSPHDRAEKAAFDLPAPVSTMVVALAQAKLTAMQTAGAALDQRCVQAATFLLGAAAVSAALLTPDKIRPLTGEMSALSCFFFVLGAVVAFLGVRAAKQQLPGVEASWWYDALATEDFGEAAARSWAAGYFEDAIHFNETVDAARAKALNWSLIFGIIGGAAVCAAAFSRLIA